MGAWVSPATPSMALGSRTPCQWTLVGSARSLTTRTRRSSPRLILSVGPGTAPSTGETKRGSSGALPGPWGGPRNTRKPTHAASGSGCGGEPKDTGTTVAGAKETPPDNGFGAPILPMGLDQLGLMPA